MMEQYNGKHIYGISYMKHEGKLGNVGIRT